jgi:hypothetical protein
MTRVAVVVGSGLPLPTDGIPGLPCSDRSALSIAMTRFGDDIEVYGGDGQARCYAHAAGAKSVNAFSDTEIGSFDIALIGRGGCGERGDLTPALLAERHGAALAYDVIDVDQSTEGFLVTRDLGRGARDILRVRDPIVVLIAETAERGPYVSRYRLNAARAKFDDCAIRGESPTPRWEPTTPRVRLGHQASRVSGRATDRINALFGLSESGGNTATIIRGSAEVCARQLLHYLGRNGFIERRPDLEFDPEPETQQGARPEPDRPDRVVADSGEAPARARRRPRRASERAGEKRGPLRVGVDPGSGNPQGEN